MFTAALLTTGKTKEQPKCPLTDEWIKKMWYRSSRCSTKGLGGGVSGALGCKFDPPPGRVG